MEGWILQLETKGSDGHHLSIMFKTDDPHVFERDGVYYLWSSELQNFDDESIYTDGQIVLNRVVGAAALQGGIHYPLTIEHVGHLHADGSIEPSGRGRFGMHVGLFVQGVSGTKLPPARAWLELARQPNQENVQIALYHFAPPHDWVTLYRVFDIVCDDLGRDPGINDDAVFNRGQQYMITKRWVDQDDVDRFKNGANNRFISMYDARHANNNQPRKGTTGMNLSEGVAFIEKVLGRWYTDKTGTTT